MEKGLWCYEANVAEPAHLNTGSLAALQGTELLHYYTAYRKHNTPTLFKALRVIGQYCRFTTFMIIIAMC